MSDPWQILRNAGLPLAMGVSGPAPDEAILATAARQAIESGPTGRDADALAAWLLAWRDHWPMSFGRGFVVDNARVLAWAQSQASSPDRYVKLRRIAVENLASLL